MKQTILISNPAYLSLKNAQLQIKDRNELLGSVPIEDIGALILEHPQITITHGAIRSLQENNASIISCDEKHMPYGLMLPLVGHSEQMHAQRKQLEVSEALKKNLWKQCVIAKIENQARALELAHEMKAGRQLHGLVRKVKTGDHTNVEGFAAAVYWKHFFEDFERDQYGDPPNNYLNYGYIVLRSMAARALVGAGLLPTIGIYHRNKYNPFCLADDIMEPFRPFIDLLVRQIIEDNQELEHILQPSTRQALLGIATLDGVFGNVKRPLQVGMEITAASLRKCFDGSRKKIVFPKIP